MKVRQLCKKYCESAYYEGLLRSTIGKARKCSAPVFIFQWMFFKELMGMFQVYGLIMSYTPTWTSNYLTIFLQSNGHHKQDCLWCTIQAVVELYLLFEQVEYLVVSLPGFFVPSAWFKTVTVPLQVSLLCQRPQCSVLFPSVSLCALLEVTSNAVRKYDRGRRNFKTCDCHARFKSFGKRRILPFNLYKFSRVIWSMNHFCAVLRVLRHEQQLKCFW